MHHLADLSTGSLLVLAVLLGLRHGLDADHLSCIDGLTRFNERGGRRIAPWCGTFFSLGHSCLVVLIATVIGLLAHEVEPPVFLDTAGTVVSIVVLVLIGSMNVWTLLTAKRGEQSAIVGVKSRFLPRFVSRTSSPLVIAFIGFCFALAAESVSQAALFGVAGTSSSRHSVWFPTILGLLFMVGMVATDTVDGHIVYRMLTTAGRTAWVATRVMGWTVVALAYGVALYELVSFFAPDVSINSEALGATLFCLLLGGFAITMRFSRRERSQWS